MGEDLEQLKQRIPLLTYLQRQHWSGRPPHFAQSSSDSALAWGHSPQLLCQPAQELVLLPRLRPARNSSSTLPPFIKLELHRYPEGIEYLAQRGVQDTALIEELGIGYARGATCALISSNWVIP